MLEAGWKAELDLSFARDGARTALRERRHTGPLRVQRPFYPEASGTCHVYLLHPPGGLVAGDQLRIEVQIDTDAHALLTTPAAAKLYRSRSPALFASQQQRLSVDPGAILEWLPQETIAFRGANAQLSTLVALHGDARFIGWEILCLGRPAAGEVFDEGWLRPRFEITRDGRRLYIERGLYEAGSPVMYAPWGLSAQPVVGTMVCVAPAAAQHLEQARAALGALPSDAHSGVVGTAVSAWDDCLVVRYLGASGEDARACFAAVWSVLRPLVVGSEAVAPRIWHT
jgi:urease accessory protein